jgi:hypothetical protein
MSCALALVLQPLRFLGPGGTRFASLLLLFDEFGLALRVRFVEGLLFSRELEASPLSVHRLPVAAVILGRVGVPSSHRSTFDSCAALSAAASAFLASS